MGQNVVGHFNTLADAEAALQALQSLGLSGEAVSLIPQKTETLESAQASALADEAVEEGVAEGAQVPEAEVAVARRGTQGHGAFIIVRADANIPAQQAIETMERFNAVEIEGRDEAYTPGDWTHVDEHGTGPSHPASTPRRRRARTYG